MFVKIFALVMIVCPLSMLAAPENDRSREGIVLEAKMLLWCYADTTGARRLLGRTPSKMNSEEVVLRADLEIAEGKPQKARRILARAMAEIQDEDTLPLQLRLVDLDPRLSLTWQEDDVWWVPLSRLQDLQSQGLSIKEGLLFERRVDMTNPNHLIAYRLHTMEGRGRIISEFGFNVGDDILSVNGTPVAKWGFQEAFSLAAGLASGSDLEVTVIPAGTGRQETRSYRIRRDVDVLRRRLTASPSEGQ